LMIGRMDLSGKHDIVVINSFFPTNQSDIPLL